MGFKLSKWDDYNDQRMYKRRMLHNGKDLCNAHLISYPPHPFSHGRQSLLVPARALLLDRFHNREVALEGVESCYRGGVVTCTILRGHRSSLLDRDASCTRSADL